MPFITKTTADGEPITTTRTKVLKELEGLTSGGVVGVIGEVKQEALDEPVTYTPKELEKIAQLRTLLIACVKPPQINTRSTPDADMRSFMKKVNAQSLGELKRFFTKEVLEYKDKPDEVPVELKNIVETKYKDISP